MLSSLSSCPPGFDPPLGRIFLVEGFFPFLVEGIFPFSGRGDFSLGVNMGSDSIPPKLFQMRV